MAGIAERLATMEAEMKHNTALTTELLYLVKGNGKIGLTERMSCLETCNKWLVWGFRGIYGFVILGGLGWLGKKLYM